MSRIRSGLENFCWSFIVPDYSLVPVDYQPDFSDVSLVPVDYDPFSADDMIQQARTQLASQPARFPMSYSMPEADLAALQPETFVNPAIKKVLGSIATLPQRAIDASIADAEHYRQYGLSTDYVPQSIGPAAETALMMKGGPGIVPAGMMSGTKVVARGVADEAGSTLRRAVGTSAPAQVENVGLAERAKEIHGALDGVAQKMRTTAVLETDIGRIVAGGGRDLDRLQRTILGRGEIAAKAPDVHAEVTALDKAASIGATPSKLAVTRAICPQCAAVIESLGGTLMSPKTAVFPRR
jgi:hypothetical protein